MTVPPILVYIVAYLGFARGIYWLFEKAEEVLNEMVVKSISAQLRGLAPGEIVKNWPDAFVKAFDAVFGKEALSWKRFWRSALASLIAVTICLAVLWAFRPGEFAIVGEVAEVLAFILPLAAGLNLVPDYVSLIETRWILRMMSRRNSGLEVVAWLAIDIVITALIFAIWVTIFTFVYPFESDWTAAWFLGAVVMTGPFGLDAMSVFFFTTFFTSVWVWLFALSTFIVRGANLLGRPLKLFQRWMDPEKPLRALGFVSSLLVTVAFLIGGLVAFT